MNQSYFSAKTLPRLFYLTEQTNVAEDSDSELKKLIDSKLEKNKELMTSYNNAEDSLALLYILLLSFPGMST